MELSLLQQSYGAAYHQLQSGVANYRTTAITGHLEKSRGL